MVLVLSACSSAAPEPVALQRDGGSTTQRSDATSAPSTTDPPGSTTTTSTSVVAVAGPDLSAAESDGPAASPPSGSVSAAQDPVPTGAQRPRSAAPAPSTSRRSGPEVTGHIEIPAIGLAHDTYEGIDLATIDHGPSHWPGTAMPGERGNTVFPGHRTTKTRPFFDIDRLRVGDRVIFSNPSGRFTYEVRRTFVVDDSDTYIVDQTDGPTFTIFACHPKGSARQRYVAQGDLVESQRTPPPPSSPPPSSTTTTAPPPDDPGVVGGLLD